MSQPKQPDRTPGQGPSNGERLPTLGDYEILERIGQGAVGAVFKARQRSMDRLVAVKVLRPDLARDAAYVDRFWREGRAAARLHHPNIVLAIDAGEDQGRYYFVMEYVDGHTVGLLLKAGPFEERRALEIVLQVARALDYAWSRERIVHRDIKPGNIIITPEGTAKLADLGLAHEVAFEEEEDSFAADGKIVGTPFYIAPEQIRRRADLDVRCDLYALGASLFHMVTGCPAFESSDSKKVLAMHLSEPVPDPRRFRPELSEGIARIIGKLMAKERDERYPDAKALAADIEALLDKGAAAPPPPAAARPRRARARQPRLSLSHFLVLCLVSFAFAVGAWAIWRVAVRDRARRRGGVGTHVSSGTAAAVSLEPAERAYEEAVAYSEAHPSDYVSAIQRFRALQDTFPGTTQAQLADQYRARLERDLEQKAKERLKGLVRAAESLVKQSKYADALAVFRRFPKGLATDAWRRRVAAARAAIERQARQRFDAALARGDEAADKNELDQAIQAYQSVGDPLPQEWRSEVAERIAAVRGRQKELAERAKAEKEAAHLRLLAQVSALHHARKYDAAAQVIKDRLDAASPEHRDELKRELDEIAVLKELWRHAERGATRLIGQPYTIRGIKGRLVEVKSGRLTIQSPGGSFSEDLLKLRTGEVLRLALSVVPADMAGLAAARLLIAEGDVAGAEARLKALEAAGTDVSHLRKRLERFGHVGLLAVAQAELNQARQPLAEGDTGAAIAALRKFLARYKEQAVAADLCAEAKRLLDEAAAPKAVPARLARLRIACDGACKVFLNGKLAGQGSAAKGQFDEVALRVRDGDLLAVEASAQSAHPALYALLDVQSGRYVIPSDATWRWQADPAEGWQAADAPGDLRSATLAYSPHLKPGYEQAAQGLPGYWIWGRGSRCGFRKVVRLRETAVAQQAAQRARQRALTTKHGPPKKATVWVACRDAYHLYLNGRHIGCAASFVPQGASFRLLLRNGDVLAVQASGSAQDGWLDAKVVLEGVAAAIRTDRTWVCAAGAVSDEWNTRGTPSGLWRPPELRDDGIHRIWGNGATLFFRKRIDLKRLAVRRKGAPPLHGRTRFLSKRRVEVTYDFREPEQLADWHCDGDWAWSKGKVGGASGSFHTGAYRMQDIEVEVWLEADSGLTLGLWGDEVARRRDYTVSFFAFRRNVAILRRHGDSLGLGRFRGFKGGPRRIVFRRDGPELTVSVDGRRIITVTDIDPIPPDELSRIGFLAGLRGRTVLTRVRITGRPDREALRGPARKGGGGPQAPVPGKAP